MIECRTFKFRRQFGNILTHIYDNKGNMIDNNLEYSYKYDYDKTGNWIQKTEFKNNIPLHILEREIEYY